VEHSVNHLITIFNQLFQNTYHTCLVRGSSEPIYLPKSSERVYNEIHFAHGFFSSALHEIAHWCVAGKERRKLEDFGYWYEPDGRTVAKQKEFEQVEIKPQALEWSFSVAANHSFRVSVDNLSTGYNDTESFKQNVYTQVCKYLENGYPKRASMFIHMLLNTFGNSRPLTKEMFDPSSI